MNAAALRAYLKKCNHPVLCVGPMSLNCVAAVTTYADSLGMPIPLIASRRQIECATFGGGYVNNWTTEAFAEYVRSHKGRCTPICRDHGGPWQGANEGDLPLHDAMQRAKQSLAADIDAGFDLLHLDPSIDNGLTPSEMLAVLFELYSFVMERAKQQGRSIAVEIGAEQQSGRVSDTHELVALLKAVTQFCEQHDYEKPLFCVVQTGTLVREMKNVGFTDGRRNETYDQKYAVETMEKNVRHLVDLAYINGVFVKEHNGDYLSDGSMLLRRSMGIGGVNIAPELGTFETKSLVTLALQLKAQSELEAMLTLFYDSKKWVKWLRMESDATDFEKAIIAGHYLFAHPAFLAIKERLAVLARGKGIDLDAYVQTRLMTLLQRFTWNLGYFRPASPTA